MKRISIFLLAILFVLGGFYVTNTNKDQVVTLHKPMNISNLVKKLPERPTIETFETTANSAILMDAETGHIIYEKNKDLSLPAASMSKIMSELLILEAIEDGHLRFDDKVEISDYAYMISTSPGLASAPLSQEQTYTVRELFELMAVISANDATIALAEKLAGSEKEFVKLMNKRAKQLQLNQTYFVNSSGLNNRDLGEYFSIGKQNEDNRLSAYDLAILAKKIIKTQPEILDISKQARLQFAGQEYRNTNMLLPESATGFQYDGVDGLKTGFTDEAGYCFVGTIEKDGQRFISVVMGTDSVTDRFTQTSKLYKAAEQLYK